MMETRLGNGPLGMSVGDSTDHIHGGGKDHFLGRVCELREIAKLEHSNTRFRGHQGASYFKFMPLWLPHRHGLGSLELRIKQTLPLVIFYHFSKIWNKYKHNTSVRYETKYKRWQAEAKANRWAHCPFNCKVAQGRGWVVNPRKSALSTISLEGHGCTVNPRWGAKCSLSSHFILQSLCFCFLKTSSLKGGRL